MIEAGVWLNFTLGRLAGALISYSRIETALRTELRSLL